MRCHIFDLLQNAHAYRLNAFKLSISTGLASGNSMSSDVDREKTKTAPELAPDLKLLVRLTQYSELFIHHTSY